MNCRERGVWGLFVNLGPRDPGQPAGTAKAPSALCTDSLNWHICACQWVAITLSCTVKIEKISQLIMSPETQYQAINWEVLKEIAEIALDFL